MPENRPASKQPPAKKAAGREGAEREGETTDAAAEAAAGDVQEQVDEMNEKGYLGEAVDPVPNEEYALTSGPDSPTAVPDDQTRVEHQVAGAAEAEPKK